MDEPDPPRQPRLSTGEIAFGLVLPLLVLLLERWIFPPPASVFDRMTSTAVTAPVIYAAAATTAIALAARPATRRWQSLQRGWLAFGAALCGYITYNIAALIVAALLMVPMLGIFGLAPVASGIVYGRRAMQDIAKTNWIYAAGGLFIPASIALILQGLADGR